MGLIRQISSRKTGFHKPLQCEHWHLVHLWEAGYVWQRRRRNQFYTEPSIQYTWEVKTRTLSTVLMKDSQGHWWCPTIVGWIVPRKADWRNSQSIVVRNFEGSLVSNERVRIGDHILRIRPLSKADFCYPKRSGTRSAGRAGESGPVIRLRAWSKPWE